MRDLINKVFDKKMRDGSIEKIVADRVDEMVKQICSDQMNWNGPAKKAMEAKLAPLILQAVEQSDLSSMVTKATMLINTALNGSEVENYTDTLEALRSLFGINGDLRAIQEKKAVKLSELFEAYKEYLKYIYDRDDFDAEDITDYDGEETATIGCSMRLAEEEGLFWRKPGYSVELSTDKSNDEKSGDIRFRLVWNYDSTKLRIWGDFRSMPLRDLQYCPKFVLYLGALERYDTAIEMDIDCADDEVEIDCRQY